MFGLWLLLSSSEGTTYAVYTTLFGLFSLLFSVGLWLRKTWGWIGTAVILIFVVVADMLTLLGLPSIPGIPEFAAIAETVYSIIVLIYLLRLRQRHLKPESSTDK